MDLPGCLWLGRLLSPVDISGGQLPFVFFLFRDKLFLGESSKEPPGCLETPWGHHLVENPYQMGSPGCLWLGRLWILSPVDMSGAQLSFILFVVRDKLYFGFRPGSHQGGSSQQSARQTLFGKDSLPNGFKLYNQICRETDLINHRHYKNTQKAKKT
jgi:hypothetical protein